MSKVYAAVVVVVELVKLEFDRLNLILLFILFSK